MNSSEASISNQSDECVGFKNEKIELHNGSDGDTLDPRNDSNVETLAPIRVPCREDFLFLEELGIGSFSTVYLASESKTHRRFAVKVCYKKQIIREKKVAQVFREKEILRQLSTPENYSPFIIQLYSTFQDQGERYKFFNKYKKDLLSVIKKLGGRLNEVQSRFVVSEVLAALAHIHALNIIHRDVKPENILIHQNGHTLLSDFGCAKKLNAINDIKAEISAQNEEKITAGNERRVRRSSFVGTAFYVSPEMLNGKHDLDQSVDYWAVGIVLFQLLTGKRPFDDESEYLVYKRILSLRYKFPEGFCFEEAKDLIRKFLVLDSKERLGSRELGGVDSIKNHIFFTKIDWSNLKNQIPPNFSL